jgi:hypothetical protein
VHTEEFADGDIPSAAGTCGVNPDGVHAGCAHNEINRNFDRMLYYLGTTLSPETPEWIAVSGSGTHQKGTSFPLRVGDITDRREFVHAASGVDDRFDNTCASEPNYGTLSGEHTLSYSGKLYSGTSSRTWQCDDAGVGSGSNSGAQHCESLWITIEIKNPVTGLWSTWGTKLVEVCFTY